MTWRIRVRNPLFEDVGELDQYASLEAVLRLNDVGTWSLTIPADSNLAGELVQPGAGIRVFTSDLPDTPVFTGPWTKMEKRYNSRERTITFTGVDDTVWLKRRVAHPSPTESFPPYDVSPSDTITNQPCSTVLGAYVNRNIGPDAVPARRHPRWTYSANPGLGSLITGSARWEVLLTFLQDLAVANDNNIGFKVIQTSSALQLYPFQPRDLTDTVKFSQAMGNLAEFTYSLEAPEANYVFVGGDGEGVNRTYRERFDGDSIARWLRIEGELVDRSGTTDFTQLDQAGDAALVEHQEKTSLSIIPIDTKNLKFGRDYYLGDKVTVQVEGSDEDGRVQDVIREAKITLNEDGQVVAPSIGTPGRQDIVRKLFQSVRDLGKRVINLEGR